MHRSKRHARPPGPLHTRAPVTPRRAARKGGSMGPPHTQGGGRDGKGQIWSVTGWFSDSTMCLSR